MIRFTGDALGILQQSLGIPGIGSPRTELADGVVDLSVDVNAFARRGRTQALSQGIYTGAMQNIHSAGNTVTSSITPYNVAVGVIAPYPSPVDRSFDVWVLGFSVRQTSGAGTMTAVVYTDTPGNAQGWGIDSAGTAVVGGARIALAYWSSILAGPNLTFGLLDQGGVFQRTAVRILPNQSLVFASTSSEAAEFRCEVLTGLFPLALGQDVVA